MGIFELSDNRELAVNQSSNGAQSRLTIRENRAIPATTGKMRSIT
jgi:hypothetical protein